MDYRLDDFTIGDGESTTNQDRPGGGGGRGEGDGHQRRFSRSVGAQRKFDTSDYVALLARVGPKHSKQAGAGKKRGPYNKMQMKREPRDTGLLQAMGIERARAADGRMENTRLRAEKRVLMEEVDRLRAGHQTERQRVIQLSVEVAKLEWEIDEVGTISKIKASDSSEKQAHG